MTCDHTYVEHWRAESRQPDAKVCTKCGKCVAPHDPEWDENPLYGGLSAFERRVLRQFTGDHQGMGWGAAYGAAVEFLVGNGYATRGGELTHKGKAALKIVSPPKQIIEYDETPEKDGIDWRLIGVLVSAWLIGPVMLALGFSWEEATLGLIGSIFGVAAVELFRRLKWTKG